MIHSVIALGAITGIYCGHSHGMIYPSWYNTHFYSFKYLFIEIPQVKYSASKFNSLKLSFYIYQFFENKLSIN